jgi:hypothetical protein
MQSKEIVMNTNTMPLSAAAGSHAHSQPPRTSRQWRDYFRRNAASLLHIPWETGVSLPDDERTAIAASIQQFQLGESSDGHHFLQAGRRYAQASGDTQYLHALRRFIAEEQRHGRDLGRVLDLAAIPRIHHAFADTVFRWLRRQAGLQLSISILVTAEIIAQVYYLALRDATGSIVLHRLCDQILQDEDHHVRFQCERLAILRRPNRRWLIALKHTAHRLFFTCTCLVFWLKHAPAMRAGNFGLTRFLLDSHAKLKIALSLMNPRNYGFPEIPHQPSPTRGVPPTHAFSAAAPYEQTTRAATPCNALNESISPETSDCHQWLDASSANPPPSVIESPPTPMDLTGPWLEL